MRIGFDAKRAFKNFTGLGNYSRFILKSLSHNFPSNDYLLFTPEVQREAKEISLACNNSNQKTITPNDLWKLPGVSGIWRSIFQGIKHSESQLDIFHGLSNEIPLFKNKSTKYVVTVHDLLFCRYPELFNPIDVQIYKLKMGRSCRAADQVIAVSEQTKKDLITYFSIDPAKIKVVYQGVHEIFNRDVSLDNRIHIKQKYNIPDRYLLFVSTIDKRKNVQLILEALKERRDWDCPLVVIGRPTSYMANLKTYIHEHRLENKVFFLHDVSFEDLPTIYKMAHVFIYPSYFEGFGIPIIEAQRMGVPVITSTGSCFREAGGNGALYGRPDDPAGLIAHIDLLSDDTQREVLIQKGYMNIKRFDQKIISRQLMEIYEEVMEVSSLRPALVH
ncbi:glycosyltransferase involved in cell wall biosynthesis [Algoriphagus sp. 4150]|uniref:glycosyltransferase family 4 protein n=1 Tax=Algoriphagus sp. 4150 TaxID=2817756 RepID=UPI0028594CEB|nr:glycosyltransferase family 1 protein [Algoriphagus sp. 4150]MDR7130094.1 glycosyltransferase involved in cell wall biosynthesis [Algoriphagus sp. 4150]